jgi:cytochrome c-type biogenesis protein
LEEGDRWRIGYGEPEIAYAEDIRLTLPSVTYPLAFLAGLLSFVSPCVLPLVPVYLGYLSGSSLSGDALPNPRQVFAHALFFVTGFTLVFVALFGLPTTLLGGTLVRYGEWIARVGGIVLILFGLHTLGVLTIPLLNMTRRMEVRSGVEPGYVRSTLIGVSFAAAWTPCIGPLLGTVITLAMTEPSRAMGLLLVYALGLAVPFLVTAALLTQAVGWLKRMNRYMGAIKTVSGVMMITIGVLLISGTFSVLSQLLGRFTPEWLLQYM